ncbi:siderophore-iron reductase FhuF [Ureibacillus sp. FSL W8-0352]|uniref:siderophore-iron reductase FhuF n=1 Tax=Ureibacillus sp. FSL W8-0352 TaxID=2954596 RepID=UPI0030F64F53
MVNTLTEKELQILQKYRLTSESMHTFNVYQLMDEIYLKEFISKIAEMIGAPSEKVAASIFMKRFAFVAVISLFAMSVWNKKLNVELNMIEMEWPEKGENWIPTINLNDLNFEELNQNCQSRSLWRQGIIEDLFLKNISPLIDKFEKTIGISQTILWENIAVYVFWLYEMELKENHQQAIDDFHYIIFEADGSLFGYHHKENPLRKYYGKKTFIDNGAELRIRKTCCYNYLLDSMKRCKTCPCISRKMETKSFKKHLIE